MKTTSETAQSDLSKKPEPPVNLPVKKEIPQIVSDTTVSKKKHAISPLPLSRMRSSFSFSASSESGSNTPNTPKTPKTPSSADRPSKSLSTSESPRNVKSKRLIHSEPEKPPMETFPFDRNLVEMEAAKLSPKEDAQQFFFEQENKTYEFFYLPQKSIYYLSRNQKFGGDPLQCTVYKVKNITMGGTLSGKAYVVGFSSSAREQDKKARENEIQILKKIHRYYGHIQLPKEYIIFQTCKVDGMDWSQWEKSYSLLTLKIIIGCMVSLSYIHEKGILHRDQKPGNYVVGPDGSVLLIDFDTAIFKQKADIATRKYCVGTFGYQYKGIMPSKMEDRTPFSKKGDWWSFGGIVVASKLSENDYDRCISSIKIANVVQPKQTQEFLADILDPNLENKVPKGLPLEEMVFKAQVLPKLKHMSQAFFHQDKGLKYAKKSVKELQELYKHCVLLCEADGSPKEKHRNSMQIFFKPAPVKNQPVQQSKLEIGPEITPALKPDM